MPRFILTVACRATHIHIATTKNRAFHRTALLLIQRRGITPQEMLLPSFAHFTHKNVLLFAAIIDERTEILNTVLNSIAVVVVVNTVAGIVNGGRGCLLTHCNAARRFSLFSCF